MLRNPVIRSAHDSSDTHANRSTCCFVERDIACRCSAVAMKMLLLGGPRFASMPGNHSSMVMFCETPAAADKSPDRVRSVSYLFNRCVDALMCRRHAACLRQSSTAFALCWQFLCWASAPKDHSSITMLCKAAAGGGMIQKQPRSGLQETLWIGDMCARSNMHQGFCLFYMDITCESILIRSAPKLSR